MESNGEVGSANDKIIYELGYILLPNIDEAEAAQQGAEIREIISQNKAEFVADELPKMIGLSFEMMKTIDSKKNSFSKGYFGWIKFSLEKGLLEDIKKELDKRPIILRYIIVRTVRESTIYHPKISRPRRTETGEVTKEISEEEIDKSIEALIN